MLPKTDELFWSKVDQSAGPSGCWPWMGAMVPAGGQVRRENRGVLAHHWAWLQRRGPIPRGKVVSQTCQNLKCCNPAHLVLKKRGDAMRETQALHFGQRFWKRADRSGGPHACWPWKGSISKAGRPRYGTRAARGVALELVRRDVPKSTRSTCGNDLCVNPAHLIAGAREAYVPIPDDCERIRVQLLQEPGSTLQDLLVLTSIERPILTETLKAMRERGDIHTKNRASGTQYFLGPRP